MVYNSRRDRLERKKALQKTLQDIVRKGKDSNPRDLAAHNGKPLLQ